LFSDDFEDWYARYLKGHPDIGEIARGRLHRSKRQTIRARHDNRRSVWATAKPDDTLSMWWKQRVAGERFFIGKVPFKVAWRVSYGPGPQFWRETADSGRFALEATEEPWFADGFQNLQGFRDFFLPEAAKGANGVFSGWEIHW